MARSLNGTNQYLSSTASPAIASGSFFACAWVTASSITDAAIMQAYASSHSWYWFTVSLQSGNNRFYVAMYDGSNNPNVFAGNGSASTGTWYHLLFIRDTGEDKIKFYIDGSLIGDATDTTTGTPTLTNFWLGNHTGNSAEPFAGNIAEAAVWTGAVPTAATIAGLAAGYSPAMFQPDALTHYWPLLNADGDQDRVGQLNLTANNTPTYDTHKQIIYRSRPRVVLSPRTYYAGGSPSLGGAAIGATPIGGSSQVGTASAPPSTPSIVGTIFRSPIIRAAS